MMPQIGTAPACARDSGGILGEHHISDMVAGNSRFPSVRTRTCPGQRGWPGQIIEAGDGVDRFLDLPLSVLPAAVDTHG